MSRNNTNDEDGSGGGSLFSTLGLATAAAGLAVSVYRWGTHKNKKIEDMEKKNQHYKNYIRCNQLHVLEGLLVKRQQLDEKIMETIGPLNIPGIQNDVEQIFRESHDFNCPNRDDERIEKLMSEKMENWKKTFKCAEYEDFKKVLQDHNE